LIELVVVLVILALLAGIAVTRLSRAVESSGETALSRDLQVLRRAIEGYHAEHGAYPTAANVDAQLTQYSDAAGATSATRQGAFIYGPYLREVPAVPTGPAKGNRGIGAAAGAGIGWVYNEAEGSITPSTASGS
jgi:general secretion pathway protein G